jgi:hypothetical protein
MAAISNSPLAPYVVPRGNEVPAIEYGHKEANSQSFKAGNFVYLNSGAVTLCGGGDVPIYGIALKDATNVTSGNIEIPIQVIDTGDTVSITVATSADVPEASDTTCSVLTAYDVNAGTTITSMVDSSDTTNPCFVFLGPQKKADGSSSNRGYFKILEAECQRESLT